jgi:hypothetical protein
MYHSKKTDKYIVTSQPSIPMGRSFSTPHHVNQQYEPDCLGITNADLLLRICTELVHLSERESQILHKFLLNRIFNCTYLSKAVCRDWILLLIHEFNTYRFGDLQQTIGPDGHGYNVLSLAEYFVLPDELRFYVAATPLMYMSSFRPYYISEPEFRIVTKVMDTLRSRNQVIKFNSFENRRYNEVGEVVPNEANIVESLRQFMGGNTCVVNMSFDAENRLKLHNVDSRGFIGFDIPDDENEDAVGAHSMICKFVTYEIVKGTHVPALELQNTWTETWGIAAKSATGRDIRVGYFMLTDDVFETFIRNVCYLSLEENITGRGRNRTKKHRNTTRNRRNPKPKTKNQRKEKRKEKRNIKNTKQRKRH